jgi:hypothetical protein
VIELLLADGPELHGIGLELGDNQEGTVNGGLILRGHGMADSAHVKGAMGSSSGEIRIGRGIGIAHRSNRGTNRLNPILPDPAESTVIPIVGTQLLAHDFELNTNKDSVRQDYIEWLPALSAGLGLQLGDLCGATVRLTGGAAIGTTGRDNGAGLSHGADLEIECDEFFALSGERTVVDRGRDRTTLSRVDALLPLGENFSMGLYGAQIRTEEGDKSAFLALQEGGATQSNERRVGLVFGGAF